MYIVVSKFFGNMWREQNLKWSRLLLFIYTFQSGILSNFVKAKNKISFSVIPCSHYTEVVAKNKEK